MIQRIQTVWLFLAAVCASLAFFVPFGTEFTSEINTENVQGIGMNAINNIVVLIIVADIILCAFIAIFSFKNRKVQKAFCLIIVLLSLACIGFMIYLTEMKAENTSIRLGIIAPILSLVFGVLALNGVRKDDKLIKNLDRLR